MLYFNWSVKSLYRIKCFTVGLGLPQLIFTSSSLTVSEDVSEPVLICVQLSGGAMMQGEAEVQITTQPSSAVGKDVIHLRIIIAISVSKCP